MGREPHGRWKVIRLEVELLNARLYAIRGGFLPLLGGEVWRFERDGEEPRSRPGF